MRSLCGGEEGVLFAGVGFGHGVLGAGNDFGCGGMVCDRDGGSEVLDGHG